MELEGEEFSFSDLENFMKEHEEKLRQDKLLLESDIWLQKKSESNSSPLVRTGENSRPIVNNEKEENPVKPTTINKLNENKMVKKQQPTHGMLLSPRDKEKEKLIREFSKPVKNDNFTSVKALSAKSVNFLTQVKNKKFTTDDREKEKDRLAEIFASSGYQSPKHSNHQIYKNLNSEIGVRNKEVNVDKLSNIREGEIQSYDVPTIFITEHQGGDKNKSADKEDKAMVGIGEYSPHNPNLPMSKPVLGVGEYEARRRMLLDQRRQEYNQYLQQVSQQMSRSSFPTREVYDHNQQHKDAATQTEWGEKLSGGPTQCVDQRPCAVDFQAQKLTKHQFQPSPCMLSPVSRCFEGLTEKEIKEHLYREELRKQIEEKYKLREEVRKKEEEEEARIEAKIQRDLEKIKRQYEEERLQRLELAIRKKEQEDLLRQRLAVEQRKATQENKVKKMQMVNRSTSPRETLGRSPVGSRFSERHTVVPLSSSLPVTKSCASKVLTDVHEELRKPLLEIQEPPSTRVLSRNASALNHPVSSFPSASSPPLPTHKKPKNVDILVNRTVFDTRAPSSLKQSENLNYLPTSNSSENVSDKRKEVDNLLRQPLLPESFQTLPPVSPPMLHATIPPATTASPPVPASRRMHRTNSEAGEERWKVPYDQRHNATPSDVFTRHNRSVLTQLGAFRKHLQEERQRMQERVRDESP